MAEVIGRTDSLLYRRGNFNGTWDDLICDALLSEREADLLHYLAGSPTRAIARTELLQHVWGLDPNGIHTRTVDMTIANLRQKIERDPARPVIIRTVRGVGYGWAAEDT